MTEYKSMKNSGVEWIGMVPDEWKISKIGSLYSLRNEKVSDKDYPPLSVTMQGILPQLATAAKSDDSDNRKLVKKGDFAINSRSDRRGSCGISPYDGSVSLINTVLIPREKMNPGYYNWLFHTSRFADEFYKWGHGIVDDLWTTRWQEMKRINIPVPSLTEQNLISNYLDLACSDIDTAIAEAKASIEDYKLLKQSIVTKAVTKGLNPDVPMKISGIEWIRKIPNHWKIERLKYIANSFDKGNGITKEDIDLNGDISCVRYGEIYSKYNNSFVNCYSKTNKSKISVCRYFTYGDILFAGTGELVEEIGKNIVYLGNEQCLAGGDIIILKHSQNPVFLNYALNSHYAQSQKSCNKAKLKVVHISASNIQNLYIAYPNIDEQTEIATYLDTKCANIDSLISEKEAMIADLEAYKKSLIFEVVTGKRKVC